jgi:hypothetical protein
MDPVLTLGTRRGWWPGAGPAFMYLVFGGITLPAMILIATMIPQNPALILVEPLLLFPVTAVFVATRLISRYAMHLYANGDVEVVQPFRRTRITPAELVGVQHRSFRSQNVGGATMFWMDFIGHDRKVLLSTSTQPFPLADTQAFVRALAARHPGLQVSGDLAAA